MPSCLIVTGESSGEKIGATLVHQFLSRNPEFKFFGSGGRNMEREGVRLLHSIEEMAVGGMFEVFSHLPRLKKIFKNIVQETEKLRPEAAILIDFPDFNLRLAKKLKKLSIPVLYYVSPTVWAWRAGRLKTIKKTVDKMLLIFPFEEKIYRKYGIPAVYVGHPLRERIRVNLSKNEFFAKYGLEESKVLICLLPGSRLLEVKNHMPVLSQAIWLIKSRIPSQFVLILAENIDKNLILKYIPSQIPELKILREDTYEAIASSDIALSACGTANLEVLLLRTPLIAFYRLSPLTFILGKRMVKIKFYSIVNILAQKKIVPELIQKNFNPKNLFLEIKKILDSKEKKEEILENYKKIDALLGEKISSLNAAIELENLLKDKKRK